MRRWRLSLVVLSVAVLVVALAAGCGTTTTKKKVVKPVGNVTYEEISVNAGEDFNVRLESNPSTGYEWKMTTSPNTAVVQPNGSEFKPAGQAMAGAPGLQVFKFKAVAKGDTSMVFQNIGPGSSAPVSWTHNVKVTVRQPAPPPPPQPPKTYTDPKTPINETAGREFMISMTEQTASTGYVWKLQTGYDKKVVVFEGVSYVGVSGTPGAASKEVWRFDALAKGTTKLTFNYVQPWDKTQKAANTMTFTVNVQ